jgi:hypothetical protein
VLPTLVTRGFLTLLLLGVVGSMSAAEPPLRVELISAGSHLESLWFLSIKADGNALVRRVEEGPDRLVALPAGWR